MVTRFWYKKYELKVFNHYEYLIIMSVLPLLIEIKLLRKCFTVYVLSLWRKSSCKGSIESYIWWALQSAYEYLKTYNYYKLSVFLALCLTLHTIHTIFLIFSYYLVHSFLLSNYLLLFLSLLFSIWISIDSSKHWV